MPLTLPSGSLVTPVVPGLDEVLGSSRVTNYRFDLLDRDENLLGALGSVEPGGSVSWDVEASIKGGGTIPISDVGTDIDWLNVRIRPTAILSRAGGGDDPAGTEVACGVFIPTTPVEDWSATGRRWNVEVLDKNSILDQDIPTDPATGNPVTFAVDAGVNIIDTVVALIQATGEDTPAIGPDSAVTGGPMFWDVGTTRLRIINDLLVTANYFALWCDGRGQYQATPFVNAWERTPVYDLLGPFTDGPSSLMAPEWKRDRDIYIVPNRYVVVGQGDGEIPPLVATATNVDPASPFSYPARGRWITASEIGVEAVDQAALDNYAQRQLSAAMRQTETMSVTHLFLPDIRVNQVVRFVNPSAGVDGLAMVTKTTIPFDPVALCPTELKVV